MDLARNYIEQGLGVFRLCCVSCSPNLHVKSLHPESICQHATALGSEGKTLRDEISALWGCQIHVSHMQARTFTPILSLQPQDYSLLKGTPRNYCISFRQARTQKTMVISESERETLPGFWILDFAAIRTVQKTSLTIPSRELWDSSLMGKDNAFNYLIFSSPPTKGTQHSAAPK